MGLIQSNIQKKHGFVWKAGAQHQTVTDGFCTGCKGSREAVVQSRGDVSLYAV